MDYRDLASELLTAARSAGADAADMLVSEGTEFSVTVRKGEVETLTEAGSKALGLRVFVGQRTATTYTSDFSWPTLLRLVPEGVGMARATSEDAAAGLPDETTPPEDVELGLYDPSPLEMPPAERIERARRAEAAALDGARASTIRRAPRGARARARCCSPTRAASWAATGPRRCRSRSCRRRSGTARWSATTGTRSGRGLARPARRPSRWAASPRSARCGGSARGR